VTLAGPRPNTDELFGATFVFDLKQASSCAQYRGCVVQLIRKREEREREGATKDRKDGRESEGAAVLVSDLFFWLTGQAMFAGGYLSCIGNCCLTVEKHTACRKERIGQNGIHVSCPPQSGAPI
jgi:hypothetical protein